MRLGVLQRSQSSQGWAVLLQVRNLSHFISRRHQLKLVYQADQHKKERRSQSNINICGTKILSIFVCICDAKCEGV
jgi:hypothetical protein